MTQYPGDRGYTAYRILQFAFIIVPILMGLDKFFYLLASWEQYLSPLFTNMLGDKVRVFFMVVGVIEIIAGIGMIFWPRVFAYIVFIWLILITLNLLHSGWFDIALRDFGLLLGALATAKLAEKYHNRRA